MSNVPNHLTHILVIHNILTMKEKKTAHRFESLDSLVKG